MKKQILQQMVYAFTALFLAASFGNAYGEDFYSLVSKLKLGDKLFAVVPHRVDGGYTVMTGTVERNRDSGRKIVVWIGSKIKHPRQGVPEQWITSPHDVDYEYVYASEAEAWKAAAKFNNKGK
ncbi:hypothetical protein [Desulfonema magnum]|uniref:Uncharacterized protein n=1 Tax=Desulfonema magnum TaxID=45655 RepID=A0A975BSB1_9BACT|nr:hypothetical protein [Desulfonema magnum]QTA90904.1 Uncharacterized protein dnm_069660 [Desulfonema magnum]